MKNMKRFSSGHIAIAMLLFAIGVCFVAFFGSLAALAVGIGIVLAVFGVVLALITLLNKHRGMLFFLKTVLAVIMLLCGIATVIASSQAVFVIADVFCLLLIIDGAFKLHIAVSRRRFKSVLWWIVAVLSVAIITAAFLLTKNPPKEISGITVSLGIIMLADGLENMLTAFLPDQQEDNEK